MASTIRDIITFYDGEMAAGRLVGVGPGNSGSHRKNAFRNMLEAAESMVNSGGVGAEEQSIAMLESTMLRCDGLEPRPREQDFIGGVSREALYNKINAYILGVVTVPYIIGLTQPVAEATIVSAGLTVGNVTTAYSLSVKKGLVISSNPPAGAEVEPLSAVDFVVSLGALEFTNVYPVDPSDPNSELYAVAHDGSKYVAIGRGTNPSMLSRFQTHVELIVDHR